MDIFMNAITSTKQGDIGEALAIYQFTKQGFTVSIPTCDSAKYDLVIDISGTLYKVQVKTSKYQKPSGSFCFELTTSGGNTSRTTRSEIKSSDYDILFAVSSEGDFWLIPMQEIKVSRTITMGDKYSKYKNALVAERL